MDNSGKFVVVWDDIPRVSGNKPQIAYVYAQRYAANSQKLGSQITVASVPSSSRAWLSNVAMSSSGSFAVVWFSYSGGPFNVRRFNADGSANGATVQMGQTRGGETQPAIGLDDAGNITLAWTSAGTLDSGWVIASKLPAGSSTPNAETLVNTTTIGGQRDPGLAVTGSGSFVVAWNGYGPGDDLGIFAQRFEPMVGGGGEGGAMGDQLAGDFASYVDLTGLDLITGGGKKK
jgi:hypothetical protein